MSLLKLSDILVLLFSSAVALKLSSLFGACFRKCNDDFDLNKLVTGSSARIKNAFASPVLTSFDCRPTPLLRVGKSSITPDVESKSEVCDGDVIFCLCIGLVSVSVLAAIPVLLASSSDCEVFVVLATLVVLTSEQLLVDRSDRSSMTLGDFSTLSSWSLSMLDVRPDFRGRSVGPTLRADLRKSLLVHLKLLVEDDTVLAGDSDLGACGGRDRPELESGVFCFCTSICFGGVFDLDSEVDLDFSDFELILLLLLLLLLVFPDPLRESATGFAGEFSLDFVGLGFVSTDSGSFFAELYLVVVLPVVLPFVYREY